MGEIGGGSSMGALVSKIGSMFMYEANQTIAIDTVDVYQAVIGFSEGSVNTGVTFLASATGVITDTESNGGLLRCTDVAHGLTTGQYISLHGMGDAAHDDHTRVTVISVDVFDCDDISHNSDSDTGKWSRGSSLTVDEGGAGYYMVTYTASIKTGVNNKNYKIEPVKGITHLDEIVAERKIANNNDLGSLGASGPVELADGDTVWLQIEGTTDATDIIFEHANLNIVRI